MAGSGSYYMQLLLKFSIFYLPGSNPPRDNINQGLPLFILQILLKVLPIGFLKLENDE
jgi:hypothetical protein